MVTLQIITATGRKGATVTLPTDLFGEKPNPAILAQAARVYLAGLHPRRGKTKTRAEVVATTAKWYRQKGTGRARHGAKSAPIFVGGGVAHGPRGAKRVLSLSKKIKRTALIQALSTRAKERKVLVSDVDKIDAKTRAVAQLLGKLNLTEPTLVLHGGERNFMRGARNIPDLKMLSASQANAYMILKFPNLVLTKQGLELLVRTFGSLKKR